MVNDMIALSILFSLFAIILLFGMIGDKDVNNRKNYTMAFCFVLLAIVVIILKFA